MLNLFELTAALLTLCAVFGFINRALLHLPNSVGLLLLGMVASMLLLFVQLVFPAMELYVQIGSTLRQIDFAQVVFNGILAFLLFAGALHVDFAAFRRRILAVSYLAILATIISTGLTGCLFWLAAQVLSVNMPLSWALVFGALISPTDPVGVLTMLKGVSLPETLKAEAEGEALLNDGVGVVIFTILVALATGGGNVSFGHLIWDFLREAVGGAVLGLVTGYLAYRAMRRIDDFPIEVLITLALVMGSYALANRLGMSGPIATVTAGLLIGYRAPQDAMSEKTEGYVSALWTLVDEVLNAVLFLLMGLEVLLIEEPLQYAWIALAAIPIVLAARLIAVGLPLLAPIKRGISKRNIPFLTWAAIRGGISIALALSLPESSAKSAIFVATYAVVVFSIVVQGLTLGAVARRLGIATGSTQPSQDVD
ncbi:MAG: cation:proton antiporter [Devosia sp.]